MYENFQQYQAYTHANETKGHSEQIIMLYNGAINYVRQAKEAMHAQDHDTRYTLINQALSVIRGLRACLDFQTNEEVAIALNNYYDAVEDLLISAQSEQSDEICDRIIDNLMIIKKAWENVTVSHVEEEGDEEEYESKNMVI